MKGQGVGVSTESPTRLPEGSPAMLVNVPPAKTRLASATRFRTEPFEFGFHGVTAPVVGSTAARRFRTWPPTVVMTPPR